MTTALTPVQQKAKGIQDYITTRQRVFMDSPGERIELANLIQVFSNQVAKTPKLLECEPSSVMNALLISKRLGLIPDGVTGQAYLIPRWNGKTQKQECNFQPGFQGLMELAWRSEKIARITPRCVYLHDDFHIDYGTNEQVHHSPAAFGEDRGELDGVYCTVWLNTGAPPVTTTMSLQECEELRDRVAPTTKDGKIVGPWKSDFEAMCLKSVIIRTVKYCPKSTKLAEVIALAELSDAGEPQPTEIDVTPAAPREPEVREPGTASHPSTCGEAGAAGVTKCKGCAVEWDTIKEKGHLPGCDFEAEPAPIESTR